MAPFFASRFFYALLPLPAALAWWLLDQRAALANPGIPAGQVWVVTLGGTIALYAVLLLLRATAKSREGRIVQGRRCQNGHVVPGFARVCEVCGAPVPGEPR